MQNTSLSLSLPVPPDRSVVFNALEVTYQVLQCAAFQGISPCGHNGWSAVVEGPRGLTLWCRRHLLG